MTDQPEHPALAGLRHARGLAEGMCLCDQVKGDHPQCYPCRLDAAIPQLEAMLAERAELVAVLRRVLGFLPRHNAFTEAAFQAGNALLVKLEGDAMSNWTKEPWPDWWPNMVIGEDKAALSHAEYQRARACVNALAGIDDPEGFMRDVRTVLRDLLPYLATEDEMLSAASLNEGRASPFDIVGARARALLAKLEGGNP